MEKTLENWYDYHTKIALTCTSMTKELKLSKLSCYPQSMGQENSVRAGGTRGEEESTEFTTFLPVCNKPQEGVNSTPASIRYLAMNRTLPLQEPLTCLDIRLSIPVA